MQRLKKHHSQEYQRLGCPKLFGSYLEGRTWRFWGYLYTFKFARLSDPVITTSFAISITLPWLVVVFFALYLAPR